MFFLVVYLSSVIVVLGLGLMACRSDYKGMVIPNYITVFVLLSFFVSYAALYFGGIQIFEPLKHHLIAGGVMFFITFVMFVVRMVGGGDSKLIMAFAFWVGLEGLPVYLFYMALSGVFIGVAAIILKRKKPFKNPAEGSWVARVQSGENVIPYGIAIVTGAFVAFVQLGFLSPHNISLFLMPN